MNKIYVVKSSQGIYEDYHEWNEKAFINKEDAEKYAKELDKAHFDKPQFVNEEFEKAYCESYDDLPDWEDMPEFDDPAYYDYQDKHNDEDRKMLVESMNKKGFNVTLDMIEEYEKWESSFSYDWHDCKVEELELCE